MFESNYVSTTKYKWWNFIVKNLFEQFQRVANIYFLVVAVITMIPAISPVQGGPNLIALVFVLAVTAIKEGWEDFKRLRSDRAVNNKKCHVLRNGNFVEIAWKELLVGEIVKVEKDQSFPADLLLISSSDPQGIAFIETANLDGETNLKFRQSLAETSTLNEGQLAKLSCIINGEPPSPSLHKFNGFVKLLSPGDLVSGDPVERTLSLKQVLFRGCLLRNTNFVYGIVIYGGHKTKYMLNSQNPPHKTSSVEKFMNTFIFRMILALVLLCIISSVIGGYWQSKFGTDHWYINYDTSTGMLTFTNFFAFLVLYSNFVPISLYVTLEVVRVCQAYFLMIDKEMFWRETDTYAIARTSNLNEELGQVDHIFSDKTGTLTQNRMVFRACTIAGQSFGNTDAVNTDTPFEAALLTQQMKEAINTNAQYQEHIDNYWLLVAACHTVNIEKDSVGIIKYQASSPDEACLLESAAGVGYIFVERDLQGVKINVPKGHQIFFKVLNVIEFDSTRKRMSVIVRDERDGKLKIFTKGADSIIRRLLVPGQELEKSTFAHLDQFANFGLRTLAMAYRVIDESEYATWSQEFDAASNDLSERHDELVNVVAEKIERNLVLLGGTAVEDKLQEGVPEAISTLIQAGIKVWVLTGDKEGTAIIIGRTCGLLWPEMELIRINESNATGAAHVCQIVEDSISQVTAKKSSGVKFGLVVDGPTLHHVMESEDLSQKFLALAEMCTSVICARTSPLQKQQVVVLVRKHERDAITLAIGDGANDVSMIQGAHIGIGISGNEGMQAVMASDYAIAQFAFLKRLLLVHGRWSYKRISILVLYFFYKNIMVTCLMIWFQIFTFFSAQTFYDSISSLAYNLFLTALPPVVVAVLDQDVPAKGIIKYPEMYREGQHDYAFNSYRFWRWVLFSIISSVWIFFLPMFVFENAVESSGQDTGMWLSANVSFSVLVFVVNFKIALETWYWTWINHFAVWGSLILYIIFFLIYNNASVAMKISPDEAGLMQRLFGIPAWYLSIVICVVLCLLPDYIWKIINRYFWPDPHHIVQERILLFPEEFETELEEMSAPVLYE
eukprot:TRINITY_DN6883_c0_g1_i1.p1 TRINITY_DN6883_c0_g1~~TRINITY_DN6883_c0_g1_i1.p1  ORF type:complete len:1134 (-),score=257.84 TRINITY_DN6883_c0_g1_i1:56-3256(-)